MHTIKSTHTMYILYVHVGNINLESCWGVCVLPWKYLQKLAAEAKYLEVIREGYWLCVYDNFNMNQRVRHEREGTCHTIVHI